MQSLLAFQGAVSFVSLTQKLFHSGWRVREKARVKTKLSLAMKEEREQELKENERLAEDNVLLPFKKKQDYFFRSDLGSQRN